MDNIEVREVNGVKVGYNSTTQSYCELPATAGDEAPKEKQPHRMNQKELEAKAKELGVDISGAKNNTERADIIVAHIAANPPAPPVQTPEGNQPPQE